MFRGSGLGFEGFRVLGFWGVGVWGFRLRVSLGLDEEVSDAFEGVDPKLQPSRQWRKLRHKALRCRDGA